MKYCVLEYDALGTLRLGSRCKSSNVVYHDDLGEAQQSATTLAKQAQGISFAVVTIHGVYVQEGSDS